MHRIVVARVTDISLEYTHEGLGAVAQNAYDGPVFSLHERIGRGAPAVSVEVAQQRGKPWTLGSGGWSGRDASVGWWPGAWPRDVWSSSPSPRSATSATSSWARSSSARPIWIPSGMWPRPLATLPG